MTTKLILVGSARTGSSYLTESLKSHPQILMHGEPFQTEHLEWHIHEELLSYIDLEFRERDPIGFIDDLFQHNLGRNIVGMKILYGQNDKALFTFSYRRDVKKIFIRRANILASYSSFALAKSTNLWNARHLNQHKAKLHFDTQAFNGYLTWQESRMQKLMEISAADPENWLYVWYSSSNPITMVESALDFLNLDNCDITPSSLKRLYSQNILDRFENPDAVEVALEEIGHPEWKTEE